MSIEKERLLREMGIEKKVSNLSAKTRNDLQKFCIKWTDVFDDLDMLAEGKKKTTEPLK